MANIDYSEYFEHIRSKYKNGETSALIGAGFSKNLFKEFPNWEGLLFDMVYEIFEIEIYDAYKIYKHTNSKLKKIKTLDEFTKEYVKKIFSSYGYLNIVLKYIEKYGYRECVDIYIEKHIPYLDGTDSNNLMLRYKAGNKASIPIGANDVLTHEKLLGLSYFNNIFTTNYDNLLEEVANQKSQLWKVVKESYNLALSATNKYIIKVHGDLSPSSETEKFCFDGDHSIKYVISAEDYKNYPIRHEAFMQMMKISLLRESFLLFGFSGKDPNFIEWVKWVRSVIVKAPEDGDEKIKCDNPSYYKIFLFAYDKDEPNEEERQFYINHRILYIPILHPQISKIVGGDADNTIGAILDYLRKDNNKRSDTIDDNINPSLATENLDKQQYMQGSEIEEAKECEISTLSISPSTKFYNEQQEQNVDSDKTDKSKDSSELTQVELLDSKGSYYSKLWRNVLKDNTEVDAGILDKIFSYRKVNRFVKYISWQENIMHSLAFSKNLTEPLSDLLLMASIDVGLFLGEHPSSKPFSKLIVSSKYKIIESQQNKLYELFKKPTEYRLETQSNGWDSYYNTLSFAFKLDFSGLKQQLLDWDAKGYWIQNKAMLLNLANYDNKNSDISKKMLLDYINNEANPKERYYATTLLNIVNQTIPYQYPTTQYEEQGLFSLWDMKDKLFEDLKRDKVKYEPYGECSHTIRVFSKDTQFLAPTRILQFLITSGIGVATGGHYVIESNDWYLVAHSLLEEYPYPTLWYTLQCSNDKVLKRIGQDYAFSDKLKEEIPSIVERLFSAYFNNDTPHFIKNSILKLLPSLFVVVPVNKWGKYFMRIWKDEYMPHIDTARAYASVRPFIMSGLPYIIRPDDIKSIIFNSINNISKTSEFIDVAHHINKDVKVTVSSSRYINSFISNANSSNDIWLLCNLYYTLSDQQVANVVNKAIDLNKNGVILSSRIIPSIAYLAHNYNESIIEDVKNMIINHHRLWDNGLSQKGGAEISTFTKGSSKKSASNPSFIKLSEVEEKIKWSTEEVTKIYNKLTNSYNELKATQFFKREENDGFISYTSLLNEMATFLNRHTDTLKEENDFCAIKNEIKNELFERRGFVNIEEGLLSNEHNSVIYAINELISSVNIFGIDGKLKYIDILLNRIVLMNEICLFNCIDIAFYYVRTYPNELLTEDVLSRVMMILKRYKEDVCLGLNIDKVQLYTTFIKMADFLKAQSKEDEVISYCISQKERFIYLNL